MDWLRRSLLSAVTRRTNYSLHPPPPGLFSKEAPLTSSAPQLKHESLPPQVLIQCLPNNTFVTVSSQPGQLLFKLSAGLVGMKNAQKTAPKGAMALVDALTERLLTKGITTVRLNFRGINASRPLIISQLRKMDIAVTEVTDTTGIPFNGCRPKKSRRG